MTGSPRLALPRSWRGLVIYDSIAVHPYRRILSRPDGLPGTIGGPAFPEFESLTWERHNRYGRPDDLDPATDDDPMDRLEGTWWWCGPVVDDFAHEFAEFSHRFPLSDVAPGVGLLFAATPSGKGDTLDELTPAVVDALAYLGLEDRTTAVAGQATLVDRLIVSPQGAQMRVPPNPDYLGELTVLQERSFGGVAPIDALFISRAAQNRGRLMGEGYVEELLLTSGVTVVHGEAVSYRALLRLAAAARRLLVTEGGACQGVSLLGSLHGDVTMLARRAREAFTREECAIPLRSRATGEFSILDSAEDFISLGVLGQEREDPNAMALVEPDLLLRGLAEVGFDVTSRFRLRDFLAAVDRDLAAYESSYFAAVMAREPDYDERAERMRATFQAWRDRISGGGLE
jgi:hypothetical protein